jgi:hypothetical protein
MGSRPRFLRRSVPAGSVHSAAAIALLLAACGAGPDLAGTWRGSFFRGDVALTCAGEIGMAGELEFTRATMLPGEQYRGAWRFCDAAADDLWARLTGEDFVFAFGDARLAVYGRMRGGDELEGNAAGLGEDVLFRARRVVPR